MMKNNFILILIFSLFLFSCEWEKLEPVAEMPENVSFANDLMPIFNLSCNMSGCHNAGGIPPDLTPENAYLNIIATSQVDTTDVENSKLYSRMSSTSSPMPPSGLLSEYSQLLVKIWIEEGAQNN